MRSSGFRLAIVIGLVCWVQGGIVSAGPTFEPHFFDMNGVPVFFVDGIGRNHIPRVPEPPVSESERAFLGPRQTITPTPTPQGPTPTMTPVPTLPVAPLPTECQNPSYYFIDEFNGSLSPQPPGWNWIRENPANWSINPNGWLEIDTERGGLLGAFNSGENMLVRSLPSGVPDWTCRTLINFNPTDNFQQAGIIAYEGDDLYLSLLVMYSYGNVRIRSRFEANGQVYERHLVIPSGQPLYLEIAKTQTLFQTRYSPDGQFWNGVAGYVYGGGGGMQLGLVGYNDISNQPNRADFDYFEIFACPPSVAPPPPPGTPTPTATPTPTCDYVSLEREEFSAPPLNPAFTWVRENPSNWSLTSSPGDLTITTEYGSLMENFNVGKNILLRDATLTENWDATVAIDANLSASFQQAGLIVYGSDDRYILVANSHSLYWGTQIELRLELGQTLAYAPGPADVNPVWFQIRKRQDDYYIFYSFDGIDFFLMGWTRGFTFANGPSVGLFAFNDLGNVSTEAKFDFFEIGFCIPPTPTPTPTPFMTPTPPCIYPPYVRSTSPRAGNRIEPGTPLKIRLRDVFGGVDLSSVNVAIDGTPATFSLEPGGQTCLADYNIIIPPQPGPTWEVNQGFIVTLDGIGDCCGFPNVMDSQSFFFKGGDGPTPTFSAPSPTPTPQASTTATAVWTATPSPTPQTPIPTSTATPTPVVQDPQIFFGGFLETDLAAGATGQLSMNVLAQFDGATAPDDRVVELLFGGVPTGITLDRTRDDGPLSVFTLDQLPVAATLPPGEFLIEVSAEDRSQGRTITGWPKLVVTP